MKITKAVFLQQFADAGLKHDDTVLIHSSMKKIGDVDDSRKIENGERRNPC